jgi:hypothetical protein
MRALCLECGLLVVASFQLAAQNAAVYGVERDPVAGGGELLTIVRHQEGSGDIPLVSVLRDTLGDQDPENDRLRYVWILTLTNPSLTQRAASALSFAYFRFGSHRHPGRVPKPVLDLASPAKGTWTKLLTDGVQVLHLDPIGALVRSSMQSYRGNAQDDKEFRTFQALQAIDEVVRDPKSQLYLPEADLRQLYSRLRLSNRTLGGLVRDESLTRFYDKRAFQTLQTRGHNWELLRQRAELCGLYFDPIPAFDGESREALLWIARGDLTDQGNHRFNAQFLNIANPWTNKRLLHWTGYTESRYFDSDDRLVPANTPGAHSRVMIPLALYSLEYPRVPLLLVDFQNGFNPRWQELASRYATTVLSSVRAVTSYGSWWLYATDSVWRVIRARRGGAVDKTARLDAYSEAREFLAANSTLDPTLKTELLGHLERLAVNPLQNAATNEATLAREQYKALVEYARSAKGLGPKLQQDRQKELQDSGASSGARLFGTVGHFFKPEQREQAEQDSVLWAKLDSRRRVAYHVHFLSTLLASSPRPEVTWDPEEIRKSVEALAGEPELGQAARLIATVLARTEDPELRVVCLRALVHSDLKDARNELKRLSENPDTNDTLRALCVSYLRGNVEESIAAGVGLQ